MQTGRANLPIAGAPRRGRNATHGANVGEPVRRHERAPNGRGQRIRQRLQESLHLVEERNRRTGRGRSFDDLGEPVWRSRRLRSRRPHHEARARRWSPARRVQWLACTPQGGTSRNARAIPPMPPFLPDVAGKRRDSPPRVLAMLDRSRTRLSSRQQLRSPSLVEGARDGQEASMPQRSRDWDKRIVDLSYEGLARAARTMPHVHVLEPNLVQR